MHGSRPSVVPNGILKNIKRNTPLNAYRSEVGVERGGHRCGVYYHAH